MRALIVCSLLLLWAVPALAAQKSAPDGFGPIKFGMTKDEAWEAIDGQGEWVDAQEIHGIDGEYLVHKVGLPIFLSQYYEVRHLFQDDRAGTVTVSNSEKIIPFSNCVVHLAYILGIITNRYGVYPVKLDYETYAYPSPRLRHVNVYQFHFQGDSMAQATLDRVLERSSRETSEVSCQMYVQYFPPQEGIAGGF